MNATHPTRGGTQLTELTMNLSMHVGLCLLFSVVALAGQPVDERLAPKTPPKADGKAKLPEPSAAPQTSPEDEVQVTEQLVGLVFVKSKEEIKREGVENLTGVEVRDIPLLNGSDFRDVLAPYLGKPAKMGTLKAIQRAVVLYCRKHDRPLVDVIVPNQQVTNGIVQIVLIEGRIGKIAVKNEGRLWFKEESISKSIRLQPGDRIGEKKLLADID